MSTELGAGAWSYFGDPRAIHHDGRTFTGWISTTGNVWVASHLPGRRPRKTMIYKGLGRDDHNNPSLVFRRDGHIVVFFSPHSGRHLPTDQVSRMRYRVSLHPYSIAEFGRVHTVDTNVPGGLGYTYPNPIQQRDKLWLFWRGGNWNPTFSWTPNGRHDWVQGARARLLPRRPAAVRQVLRRRPQPHPLPLLRRTPEQLENEPSLRPLREQRAVLGRRPPARDVREHPAAHVEARSHLSLQRPRRACLAARHRARRPRPAVRRLHAPARRHPRHLLLRLLQRHALGQPQDRRGRPPGRLIYLGRRDARPRGSARGLSLAADRDLVPGRDVGDR